MDLQAVFSTLSALAGGVLVLEELVDRFWNLDGISSQVRTLVLGVALGEIGAGFSFGMFADVTVCGSQVWYVCGAAIGFTGGCIANFAFLTPLAKWVLELLKIRPKSNGN